VRDRMQRYEMWTCQARRDVGGGKTEKGEGGRERRPHADRCGRVEVNDRGADDSG
jgi:hypothetical protein